MNYKELDKEFEEVISKAGKICYECEDTISEEMRVNLKDFYKAKINKVIDECIGKKEYLMWENRCEDCKSKDIYQSDCPKCNSIEKGYKQKVRELKEYKKEFNKLST